MTTVAVFGTAETGTGLPAALKAAQPKVKLIGWGPPPAILGYIKEGQWDAGVGVDGFTMQAYPDFAERFAKLWGAGS